ncbi:hypothetical protein SMIM3I_02224 [Streptococcus mitis]|uniref:Uncharacterized protein n=1 Tax=Streptococcus mitis TaxID=28037 RepID=A0A150NNN1_STRMT|nr:hypothetical protein SMIM3I_02224 [Streptococcus mitis]
MGAESGSGVESAGKLGAESSSRFESAGRLGAEFGLKGTTVVSGLELLAVTGVVEVADSKTGAGRAILVGRPISQN